MSSRQGPCGDHMDNVIEIHNIFKIYNEGLDSEVRALNGVSLTVERGEFLSIVGPSGSGKSTLMNILGCLDMPTYGDYTLNSQRVSSMPDRKLASIRNREIGFVFQGFNLLGGLTAAENVELPLIYQGVSGSERHERAEDALMRVGLLERMFHKPSELSGGQQQRVAIARAIATKPSIIMADEPTGNLDSRTGEHVIKILNELHADGTTIILITHDLHVSKVARRSVSVADGNIVADEQLREVTS